MDAYVIDDRGHTKTLVTRGNWCLRFSGKDMSECGYDIDDTVFVIAPDKTSIQLYNKTDLEDHRDPCDGILGNKDDKNTYPCNRSDITSEHYIIPKKGIRYLPLIKKDDAFLNCPIPIGKLTTFDDSNNACKVNLHEIQLHYSE